MRFRLLVVMCLCATPAFAASEMQKLATLFSGRWTFTDTWDPSPEHPNGLTRTGEELWHTLAGGLPLIEEYHSTLPKGGDDEYDTAAFWWDAKSHKYRGLFCADFVDKACAPFDIVWQTASGHSSTSHKDADKDQLIMTGEYLQGGKKYAWKETFAFSTSTTFTQTLFLGEPGHELKRSAVIFATRVGAAP